MTDRADICEEKPSGILADCTHPERIIMTETIPALKDALRKYG